MADETLAQQTYRKALANQRSTLRSNGNTLVNPSMSNDASTLVQQATQKTDSQQYKYTTTDADKIANTSKIDTTDESQNKETKNYTWYEELMGAINNRFAHFVGGLSSGLWEGIADLGATAIGTITGNQDILDWAKIDYSGQLTDWIKDDYYDDREISDYENFMTSTWESVGNMLPSVLLTLGTAGAYGAATGATMTESATKLLGTTAMSLSAAGSAAEEALNEGAEGSNALLYGLASGGVEFGTEYLPFDKLLGSSGSVGGTGLVKSLMKGTFSEFATAMGKDMVEEGLEEVAGELVSPFVDIIKGTDKTEDLLSQYGTTDYWKGVGEAFLSGAASTAIMGVSSTGARTIYYGKEGNAILNQISDVAEKTDEAKEQFRNGEITGEQLNAITEQIRKQAEEVKSNYENMKEGWQKDHLSNKLVNPKYLNNLVEYANSQDVKIENDVKSLQQTQVKSLIKSLGSDILQQIANEDADTIANIDSKNTPIHLMNKEDIAKQYGEDFGKDSNVYSFYDPNTNQIVVDADVAQDKYAQKVAHEVTHKTIGSDIKLTQETIDSLKENNTYKEAIESDEMKKTIIDNYQENFTKDIVKTDKGKIDYAKTYENILKNTESSKTYNDEVLAHFVENSISDSKSWNKLLKSITDYKSKNKLKSLVAKIRNSLDSQNGALYDKLSKAMTQLSDINVKENAQTIQKQQLAYSKVDMSNETDSEGNKLSQAQVEFFKDSKVRDEDGSLKVIYHGSYSKPFYTFDKSKASPEGDWGSGFYATSNYDDASQNYEGGGPDYDNKVERLAEQISNDQDIDYDEAKDVAREQLGKDSYLITAYGNMENPAIVGETYVFENDGEINQDDYSNEEEYYEALDEHNAQIVEDVLDDIRREYDTSYGEDELRNVLYEAMLDGGIEIQDLKNKINEVILDSITDESGNIVANDIARIVLESLGYDGIIDNTVSSKFKNMNIDSDTTHYIFFNSNQIKDTSNLTPTSNEDIRYSKENINKKADKSKAKSKPTYKSMQTTREFLDAMIADINRITLRNNYDVILPKNAFAFTETLFNDINDTNIEKSVNNIMESLKQVKIQSKEGLKLTYNLTDMIRPQVLETLKKDITRLVKTAPNTEARNKATLSYQRTINKITAESNENAGKLNNLRRVAELRKDIKQKVEKRFKVDDRSVVTYGLDFLYQPFRCLYASDKGFSAKEYRSNIQEALDYYTEENMQKNNLPFDQGIRDTLIDLRDSLGYPVTQTMNIKMGDGFTQKERLIYGSLTSESLQLTKEAILKIRGWINKENKKMNINAKPSALEVSNKIKTRNFGNTPITRLLYSVKNKFIGAFAPRYAIMESLTGGNTELSRITVKETSKATNDYKLFTETIADKISDKLKKLKLKVTDLDKKIKINGYELTINEAISIRNLLITNFDDVDASGFEIYDKDTRLGVLSEKDGAKALQDEINKTLTDSQKEMGDFILEIFNTDLKQAYTDWYMNKYGNIEGLNTLGKIGDKTYYPLFRNIHQVADVETMAKNPEAMFKHGISRVNNTHPIRITGAIETLSSYTDALGKATYLMPVYQEYKRMMNAKVDSNSSLERFLETKITKNGVDELNTQMENFLGFDKATKKGSFLNTLMAGYTTSVLGFNISTILKQPLSLATGSIPLTYVTKGVANRFNETYKAEYDKLVNGVKNADGTIDKSTIIGGLKYRQSAKTLLDANGGIQNKVSNVVMKPIAGTDKVAMDIGVYALMDIGEKQFGYKVGTKENIDFVKEQWTWFEYSQIGRDALQKSAITGGDYNDIVKAILGYMQGAPTAALGSFITKTNLYLRNKGVNETELDNRLKQTKEAMESAKEAYEEDTTDKDALETYQYHRSRYLDAKNKKADFDRYKACGAKSMPVQMAAGLIVNGLLITLIGEAVKRLRGKKDWDEWDMQDIAVSSLENIVFNWMPMSSTVINMINGYDVSIPSLSVINEVTDMIQDAKSQDWQSLIRQGALTISEATGVPMKNVYEYLYGFVNFVDKDSAYTMKNFVYGISASDMTSTYNTYVSEGKTDKATDTLQFIMKNYRTGEVSETLADELVSLSMNGYDVLPNARMTSYTDDNGNSVALTSSQQETFYKTYSKSNKIATNLLNVAEYKSATQELQATAISKIYDAYYNYSKAKTLGLDTASSRLGNLLLYTDGNVDLSKYVMYLANIATIEANETKTRKELVTEYLNKSKLNINEKYLILTLSGYSISSTSTGYTNYKSYLRSKGMSTKQINAFLGIK